MRNLLKKGSILILLGTGGVGKTTVAAALGLAAAEVPLDTALITVDPARRLRRRAFPFRWRTRGPLLCRPAKRP